MRRKTLRRPTDLRQALRRENQDVMHRMRVQRNTPHDYDAPGFHFGNHERIKEVVLLEAFDYKCFYCGVALTFDTATRDHLIPKKCGGKGSISNLVLCCYSCNQLKWDDCATEDEINRAHEIMHRYRQQQLEKDREIYRRCAERNTTEQKGYPVTDCASDHS